MKKASDNITESDFQLCSYDEVATGQEEPELATNEEWRGIMVRARKDHGWSQEKLAEKVKTSQAMISKIESGESRTTTLVMPICRALGIPPPEHFVDEFEKEWVRLGRALRYRNEAQARAARTLIESMVKQYEALADEEAEPPEPERPTSRRK